MSKGKVVLLGIDGADYHITKEFIEKGELPNIKRAVNLGVFSKLKSTLPPLSPTAWTSIFTGVPPAIHSIYGFTKRREGTHLPDRYH